MNPNQKPGETAHHGTLKVINLFGAPGTGKSATRSGLFWLMKVKGMSVEEVSEYAKYLVLAGRQWQLNCDQLYILAKQHHKLLILEGQYQFAVTDSPLMLASYYSGSNTPQRFHGMCMEYFQRFENINFFLTRDLTREDAEFEETGRNHNREDAIRIEQEQKEFLDKKGISWIDLEIDHAAPWEILKRINQICPGSVPCHGPAEPAFITKANVCVPNELSSFTQDPELLQQSAQTADSLGGSDKGVLGSSEASAPSALEKTAGRIHHGVDVAAALTQRAIDQSVKAGQRLKTGAEHTVQPWAERSLQQAKSAYESFQQSVKDHWPKK